MPKTSSEPFDNRNDPYIPGACDRGGCGKPATLVVGRFRFCTNCGIDALEYKEEQERNPRTRPKPKKPYLR